MMSTIDDERSDFHDISPTHHLMESTILDLPHPLGPITPVIPGLRSRRTRSAKDLKPVIGGLGVEFISTSRGVMTANEARKKHLGGEVICRFY